MVTLRLFFTLCFLSRYMALALSCLFQDIYSYRDAEASVLVLFMELGDLVK